MELFKELLDYAEYLKENTFHQNLSVNLDEYGDLDKKIIRERYLLVDPENNHPFSVEMDDSASSLAFAHRVNTKKNKSKSSFL